MSRSKKKVLIFTAVTIAAAALFLVLNDPLRDARRLAADESWSDEYVQNNDLPPDILSLEPVHARVFRFTQDPLVVFSKLGGESKYLETIKSAPTATASYSLNGKHWTEHDDWMETYGLPIKLRSGRDADFMLTPGKGRITCKLIIRPLKTFSLETVRGWFRL